MPLSQPIIQALPSDVIAKLESSTSIVHLSGVILELVKNALDANAHTVFVTVDFKRGGCIVEDDGDGIPPIEFEATGGLGRAHRMYLRVESLPCLLTFAIDTSKFKLNDSYGHRGLFLASLASLSLLTLTSHYIDHESTNSLILHHSRPVARLIPAPPHQALRFASHGTSITVNDLFGNMPVRVKSRALSLQRPDELEREWDNMRNALVSLLLANSRVSKLVLLDAEKGNRISIRPGTPFMSAPNHLDDHVFDIKRIGAILTQSGLINPRNWDYWHELSASVPDLTVRGAISLQPSPTRKMQFISLGKKPLQSHNSSNILYSEINRLFSLSDFGNFGAPSDYTSTPIPVHLVDSNDAPSNASAKSWTKPINKWPMFYIRIEAGAVLRLNHDGHGHPPESDKSVRRIVDVLGAMLHEFLKQHKMRPRSGKRQTLSSDRTQNARSKVSRTAEGPQGSLRQGRSISSTEEAFSSRLKIPSFPRSQSVNSGQGFTNWSRVKAAKELKGRSPTQRPPRSLGDDSGLNPADRALPTRNHLGSDNSTHDRDFTTPPKPPITTIHGDKRNETEDQAGDLLPDKMIAWIDPQTKLAYLINPRTGQTINSRTSLATQKSSLANGGDVSSKQPAQGLWIESMLERWDNPSFSRTEIPILNLGQPIAQNTLNASHECFKGIGSLDTAQVAKYRGKLWRRGLEAAEVIAQVDKKFILAKVPTTAIKTCAGGTSDHVLLLVDQHAADERCRIEQLFEDMFLCHDGTFESDDGVRTVQVFIKFEVSETEGNLFHKHTTLFSAWGLQYDTEIKSESTVLVTVHTLPVLIAERCRVEPHVLIDLIRREIWSTEEIGIKPFQRKRTFESEYDDQDFDKSDIENIINGQPTTLPDTRSWIRKMSGCPQGIIDLLNSRACRTAIMFNDPLNIKECQALISRLARCAFPFQCAHGRPSMVPIVDLRSLSDTAVSLPLDLNTTANRDNENDGTNLDFMEAFRTRYIA
jgi:DNA mismatch repair protein MLH3